MSQLHTDYRDDNSFEELFEISAPEMPSLSPSARDYVLEGMRIITPFLHPALVGPGLLAAIGGILAGVARGVSIGRSLTVDEKRARIVGVAFGLVARARGVSVPTVPSYYEADIKLRKEYIRGAVEGRKTSLNNELRKAILSLEPTQALQAIYMDLAARYICKIQNPLQFTGAGGGVECDLAMNWAQQLRWKTERTNHKDELSELHMEITVNDIGEYFVVENEESKITAARRKAAEAIRIACDRLKHAIYATKRDLPIPHDVEDALEKFFSGTRQNKLVDLLKRIEPMEKWILHIPVEKITTISIFKDEMQKRMIMKAIKDRKPPAVAFPPYDATGIKKTKFGEGYIDMIALLPAWYEEERLQPTRLLHEAFHYSYTNIVGHPPVSGSRWDNAYAYQGLVSALGGLPTGSSLDARFQ